MKEFISVRERLDYDSIVRGTCFVDFNNAAVCDFFDESQQTRLIIPQAGVLISLSYALYAYRLSGQCCADQTLTKMLTASELQHA